jgi:hypothetical protein
LSLAILRRLISTKVVSGLIEEAVTEDRPVRAWRYELKALYSGGESYDFSRATSSIDMLLTAETWRSVALVSIAS